MWLVLYDEILTTATSSQNLSIIQFSIIQRSWVSEKPEIKKASHWLRHCRGFSRPTPSTYYVVSNSSSVSIAIPESWPAAYINLLTHVHSSSHTNSFYICAWAYKLGRPLLTAWLLILEVDPLYLPQLIIPKCIFRGCSHLRMLEIKCRECLFSCCKWQC